MSLAAENVRLAFWVARRYTAPDPDGVASAALLGLVEAEAKHDPARSAFSTFAVLLCRQRAVEEVYRQRRDASREVSLCYVAPDGHEEEREDLPAVLPHDGSGLMAEAVRAAVDELPEREREIVSRRFGLDGEAETLATIGAGIGLSRARVGQLERMALRRLRRALSRRSRQC